MSDLPNDLSTLEVALRNLSHSGSSGAISTKFCRAIGKNQAATAGI